MGRVLQIFLNTRYNWITRLPVDIGAFAEKEVIQ